MALSNLSELLVEPFERYPYLSGLLASIAESSKKRPLTVTVTSFSYKKEYRPTKAATGEVLCSTVVQSIIPGVTNNIKC